MIRSILILILAAVLCASCGELSVDPQPFEDEPADFAAEPPADGLDSMDEPIGLPAEDVLVGEPIASADPVTQLDPCADHDECDDGSTQVAAAQTAPGSSAPKWTAGTKLITLKYAAMRKAPRGSAGRVAVHTGGGVHGGGHPRGTIPPGQQVVLLDKPRTNGFYKVRYKGAEGWVHRDKLERWDHSIHPIEFAKQGAVRDAFFMHQIRRSKWNKDGPLSSGNCAPTSLAMAAKIFGKGTRGKTIEGSIHEVRNSYGASRDENDGTSRSEIIRGAKHLGLDVKELGTNLSLEGEMDRIDAQLGKRRAIVLEGRPGSAYRSRMTAAFHNQGVSRSYTYSGNHSILVVAKLDNGKYLVADPISEVGMVTMSRSQLKSFFKAWGGTGTAVYDRDWNK